MNGFYYKVFYKKLAVVLATPAIAAVLGVIARKIWGA